MGEDNLLWFIKACFPSFIFFDSFRSSEGRLNFEICMPFIMFEPLIKKTREKKFSSQLQGSKKNAQQSLPYFEAQYYEMSYWRKITAFIKQKNLPF